MKKVILSMLVCLIYSSQSQASLLNDLLNDKNLDSINCVDLNYDHDSQQYKMEISIDIKNKQAKGVALKQNYGQERTTIDQVEASSDLKAFWFSNYKLELTDKQFFDSNKFRANLTQSNAVVAELVCGFVFWTTGE